MSEYHRIHDHLWELPARGPMRVPGRVYASAELMRELRDDPCLEQVRNVACLPGIVGYSMAMPDIHWGYGFPIGGVAAFDPKDAGVISPGGVGFDINCGVRLLRVRGVKEKRMRRKGPELAQALLEAVPAGVGRGGALKLTPEDLDQVALKGAAWMVENGFGRPQDLDHCEEGGQASWAQPKNVSSDAKKRARNQLGTLGSGNHFLEVQVVDEIHDPEGAEHLQLEEGSLTVLIHTGSRGFGHQICDDYLDVMIRASKDYGLELPDKQLCAAPFESGPGQDYFQSMGAGMNFAFANRQLITHRVREVLQEFFGPECDADLIYDVCHNIAKKEEHYVGESKKEVVVHRKGATRAFGPGHPLVPPAYRQIGQPVLVPGDMGRYSYLLLGQEGAERHTFASCCHGAGRRLSRTQARKRSQGRNIQKELASQGICLQAFGRRTVGEEISEAYKDVADVVASVAAAGLARIVARLRPAVVVKG
ncbi:MAG: RtcB family protein [Planctomycetota bacterium]|nr:MAG: RtcB family protein [Planctomycetota bacterium]